MSKFPISLGHFKKIHDAEDHAVLKHPQGHEFKIAKRALSPKMRSQLNQLPTMMADGGQAESPVEAFKKQQKSLVKEYEAAPKNEPSEIPASSAKTKQAEPTPNELSGHPFGMAEGGEAESDNEIIKKKAEIDEYNKLHEDEPKEYPQDVGARLQKTDVTPKQYARGGKVGGQKGGDKAFFANGTINADGDDGDASDDSQPATPQAPVTINVGGAGMPIASSPQDLGADMKAKSPAPAAASPSMPAQAPSQQALPSMMGGYQQQVSGIQEEAAAQSALAKSTEAIAKGQAKAQADLMTQFQNHYQDLDQERQNFQQDILNNHIDPNRYLGNQDSMGRMLTSVGLILGGMGGGGVGNQALDFMNRQIDRDIESQKADLGKRETLLSANLHQFGNLREATEMTRLQMNDLTSLKFQEAAARSNSPLAQAKAQQMIGQLQQQVAPTMQQLAMRQMLMSPNAQSMDPANKLNALKMSGLIDEKTYSDANKELSKIDEAESLRQSLRQSFNDLNNQMLAGHLSPEDRNSAIWAYAGKLQHLTAGRFNMEDAKKQIESILPQAFESDATRTKKSTRLDSVINGIADSPTLRGLNINPQASAQTQHIEPREQSFVKWARNNPQDPRSAMVLKKFGLQ